MAKSENSNMHYVLCGIGDEEEELKQLSAKLGIKNKVHFLGYRKDVKEIYGAADIFALPSYREGLSRSLMEAMASGLPCIVSKIRGNVDLVEDGKGGFHVPADDVDATAKRMKQFVDNKKLRNQMSERNIMRIRDFNTEKVREVIGKIYEEELL